MIKPRIGLTAWLILLALGASVPLLLFAGATIVHLAKDAERIRHQAHSDAAESLARTVDGEVEEWVSALTALANFSDLEDEKSWPEFHQHAREVAVRQEGWIVLTDPVGRQLLDTSRAYGGPRGATDTPELIQTAFAERRVVLSGVYRDPRSQESVLTAVVPVIRRTEVRYVLQLTARTEHVARLLAAHPLPGGWAAHLLDQRQRVITPTADQAAPAPVLLIPDAAGSGLDTAAGFVNAAFGGAPVRVAFHRLHEAPWIVAVAAPPASPIAPLLPFLLVGLGASVLVAGLAVYTGRKITSPLARLARASRQILTGEGGDLGPAAAIREVRQLQDALGEAATAVQAYYRERERARLAEEAARVAAESEEAIRQSAQAVAASERRYRALVELSPEAIVVHRGGRYLYANPAALRLFGAADLDELQTHAVLDLVVPEERSAIAERLKKVMAGGCAELRETTVLRLNGETVPVEAVAGPVEYQAAPATLSILRDTSARKAAESALHTAYAELERRVQERTAELAAALATLEHQTVDLRVLAAELTLTEQRERRRVADVLRESLQQLVAAARVKVLTLARDSKAHLPTACEQITAALKEALETGRMLTRELSPPSLHSGGLVAALEWLAQWLEAEHRLKVDMQVEQSPGEQLGEELSVLCFECVRELLLNVVQHAQVDAAQVSFVQRDDGVELSVVDAGVGFEPAGLRACGGTLGGYGLFRIRQFATLLGGTLDLASAPGQGSRILLRIPLYPGLSRSPEDRTQNAPAFAGAAAAAAESSAP